MKLHRFIPFLLFLFTAAALTSQSRMHFTVSMEQPSTHIYQVQFECQGIEGPALDLKMPAWTPGYYWILNLAKNVSGFEALDDNGNPLAWNKTAKNTWRVEKGNAASVKIRYNVYAFTQSVADPYLDDGRGFISPTGIFMFVDGRLDHPVTVAIKLNKNWSKISTGLDPVAGQPGVYQAENFDILYDCPILAGNQEIHTFEVQGIPHRVALENPVDPGFRDQYLADLKKMVETGSAIIGEIPYKHYTFIIMGPGGGGLEHSNSTAVYSGRGYSLENPAGYKRWLAFLAHEYFHLYNIKSIRPIALGPFDYDRENLTRMLWFSEGFTVYYEYLIVNRAGLMTCQETLDAFTRTIVNYEHVPGRLAQSAAESSYNTWLQFFNRSDHAANTTISYYDKGCALGLLMDLKIRHETRGAKSLDDVMRTLYQTFFVEKKRGFTDEEFREVCERTAGCSLSEIFDYAATTQPIDYAKYLAYAGLSIDLEPVIQPGAFWGATLQMRGNELVVTAIEQDSPAWNAGLSTQDRVLELNGAPATPEWLAKFLESARPGDVLKAQVSRRSGKVTVESVLGQKRQASFRISLLPDATADQKAILEGWLR